MNLSINIFSRRRFLGWERHSSISMMSGVKPYEDLLADLKSNPAKRAKDAWDYKIRSDPGLTSKFKGGGGDDIAYQEYLRNSYQNTLVRSLSL